MLSLKKLAAASIAAVAMGAGTAHAASVTFDSVNDEYSFLYAGSFDGATLNATVTYKLVSWSGSTARFGVTAVNSSFGPGQNRLTSFGIDVVNPDLIWASANGTEWDAAINVTAPGFGTVDLCNYSGSNCAGGASGGVLEGDTDSFYLDLWFDSSVNSTHPITFTSPYTSKWQSVGVNGRSYEFGGCIVGTEGCGGTTTQVPEPATLGLLGLGMLGVGATRLRRRKA